jgi:hypothetical protein
MDQPRLLATCSGGNCPEITRVGNDWHVQGYDENGIERTVRIPRTLGHMAAVMDEEPA